jgi:ACS family D-galactonate transporter-like MFS transporter
MATATMSPSPSTHVRFRVALMLFVTVAINYLDRSNLSVAATDLSRDLNLGPVKLGVIFSGFGWAYVVSQIPGGWLVDRVDLRVLYAVICTLWSLATLAQGFASTFLVLLGFRLLLGLFEAPTFPICNKLATRWFPEQERAGAIGFYTSGQYIGLAFLTPLLAYSQKAFGWRSIFFITGAIGLVWAALWYLVYRDPSNSRGLGEAEMEHIRKGGGFAEGDASSRRSLRFDWSDLAFVLSQRKLWGLYLGQFTVNALPWFFLTWFPTYLVTTRHINLLQAGIYASLPFLAAFLGVISGGLLSDSMVRRGFPVSLARKGPIIAGMVLSGAIVFANYIDDPRWMVFFMAVAFFGNGFASITWVLVSLVAPVRLLGLTGGVFNFIGNLSSIVVPLAVGFLVKYSGFPAALGLVAAIALGGALSYVTLVGKIERIPDSVAP